LNHSKWLRSHLKEAQSIMQSRGVLFDVEAYEALEQQRRNYQDTLQTLQQTRNARSKDIGRLKHQGECTQALMDSISGLNDELKATESSLNVVLEALHKIESELPNIPHESVPDGRDESDNQIIEIIGTPRTFDFPVKHHIDLGEQGGGLDFEAARNLSGARFALLKGSLARLHRILAHWMLDTHITKHGYEEILPPVLVKQESLYRSGQLPKFEDDLFLPDSTALGLIPTAEVPLVNCAADHVYATQQLPLKWVAYTPCFRKEAGAYGKDTRGMMRLHQFEKVELVQIVQPEDSYDALEAMRSHSESILKALDLPYRVVNLCKGDLGFCAAKTYDIEVWIPGEHNYREIASISNCEAFQARRLKARMRDASGDIQYLHTLNGSALPIGRTLIALMEHYQNSDGRITIPEVLRPYFNDETLL